MTTHDDYVHWLTKRSIALKSETMNHVLEKVGQRIEWGARKKMGYPRSIFVAQKRSLREIKSNTMDR